MEISTIQKKWMIYEMIFPADETTTKCDDS